MTKFENRIRASEFVAPPTFAAIFAALISVLPASTAIAQSLSVDLTNDLVPLLDPFSPTILTLDSDFSAYDRRQVEALGDLARKSQSAGEHQQARVLFRQALHVARVNDGLYHESQIPIIDNIISVEIAMGDWEAVDDFYTYQEHLYKRLYGLDDPRLEAGLKKVSAWHINALNANIDGKRMEHLRKVNQLFKLRMQIAENTLAVDDPKVVALAQNIEICEREIFLASDLNREMMARQDPNAKSRPSLRRKAYSERRRQLLVTLD